MVEDRRRTLVVEDDNSTCTALALIVSHLGHEVDSARTLKEAFAKLGWNPSFVILDLMLPDGNGIELLRRIKAEDLPIRVAITTGMDEPTFLAEVAALGPQVFLRKPIDLRLLERWLGSQSWAC